MKSILKSATLLVASFIVAYAIHSCTSVKPIEKTELQGYWVLKTLKGEAASTAFSGAMPSLEFDFDKKMIYGSGGCNRYTSSFSLTEENTFTANAPATTQMLCVEANKEADFLSALATPNLSVSLSEDGILTFSKDKEVLLQFVRGEAPSIITNSVPAAVTIESIVGKWNLTAIEGGDMAKLFTQVSPFMEIEADGKVFGKVCNSFRTNCTLDNGVATFSPVITTRMTCKDIEGENMLVKTFESPLMVTLNGDTLTFMKDDKMMLEFAKVATEE